MRKTTRASKANPTGGANPSNSTKRGSISAAAFLAAGVMALAACTGGGGGGGAGGGATAAITNASEQPPTTISVWTFNKLPAEVDAIKQSIARLQDANPWLTVNLVTAKEDADFSKAVTSGQPPDVFISPSPDNVAKFCYNGTVIDMNPLAQSAGLDVEGTFPASVLIYSQYENKLCALPLLVDAYALFYNKDMLTQAGITEPPKTLSELLDDVKKLTVTNADGTIERYGIVPPRSDYAQNGNYFIGGHTGAQFYDADGKATFGTDPVWTEELNWQKSVLDFYGKDNVDKFMADFQTHSDDADSAFVTGKAAMEFAGEWHIGENDTNNPDLNYGVAPVPVPDSKADIYGAGSVLGTVVYIPAGSKQQAAAFLAVQQLTTDQQFLDQFATEMSNIPTTFDSLKSWEMASNEHWKTFTDIAANANSYYKSLTPAGSEDRDTWVRFIGDWEQGKVSDLASGLQGVAKQIDDLNAQSK